MRELSLFCFLVFVFLLCPSEDLKDRLIEVIRLVGENVMARSSDHLTRSQTFGDKAVTWQNVVKLQKKAVLKRTYPDFYIWSGFLERLSRVTVNAGPWSIDERNGNVRLDLADPLQHGPLCPAIGDSHVLKGGLSTETQISVHGDCTTCCQRSKVGFSPWSLGIQMVDIVRHRVVVKHRSVFLLEVWPDHLDQHWTWKKRDEKEEIYLQILSVTTANKAEYWQ